MKPELAEKLASGKLTPMMRQYLGVKVDYPNAVVLMRMGDFFETFYEDAETFSRLLDITLTKRSKEKDAAPMAGVPHHAIGGYISRLIEMGRTVVLIDQVEDPKKAKGLVRREVTRVISPGTFVDANAPARVPNYLVSVVIPKRRSTKKPARWGLAALDLATGEFRATSSVGDEALLDELGRLAAREVIVAEASVADPLVERIVAELSRVALTPLEAEHADKGVAADALARAIDADELSGLQQVLSQDALHAAGQAIRYVEETQLRKESFERKKGGSLGHIDTVRPYLPGDALILDTEARTHLELFGSSADGSRHGALLGVVDLAVNPMGGRLLARWLARPLIDPVAIDARLDAVAAFVLAPSRLDALREALANVYDLERLLGRVMMGRSNPRDLASLRASLERMPEILAAAADADSARALSGGDQLGGPGGIGGADGVEAASGQGVLGGEALTPRASLLADLAATDPCESAKRLIADALVEAPPSDLGGARVFREGFDVEMDRLMELSISGKQVLADIERRERERTGITSLKVKFNKVFGYFIEVTKANIASVPDDYVRKQTTVNAERYFTEELKEYEEQVLTANDRRAVREAELFAKLVADAAAHARPIKAIADAAATLDALGALAHVAERHGWARPEISAGDELEIVDGRHPVLESLAEELGERFVPNDLTFADDQRLLIITGPNMAGKSTIMRQTALIVILAQMGSFVPARSARIGVVDRVFTRVGASDELSRGRSTFMVEMTEAARILRSATSRSLILLDEIGRGTSTFDGLSIAWAVAEYLHDSVGAKTLFATHYHELTEICRDKPRAANLHVAVKAWNDDIVFLRKLLPGPTNRSYGVQVARLAGLPKKVIERARVVLATLEAQELAAGDHSLFSRARDDQLNLFAAPSTRATTPSEGEVLDAIRALGVDDTTPRAALALIAEWQAALAGD